MLNDAMRLVEENPRPPAMALAIGVVVGFALGWALYSGGSGSEAGSATMTVAPAPQQSTVIRGAAALGKAPLKSALNDGVKAAQGHSGTVQAAVAVDDGAPIVAGDSTGARMPPWTMLRPAVAVVGLQAGLGDAAANAVVDPAGCGESVVLAHLQQQQDGKSQQVVGSVKQVLRSAGAPMAAVAGADAPAPAKCHDELKQQGLDPGAKAPQLDGSKWTIADALALTRALGTDKLGDAGTAVVDLMQQRPGDWGAGPALADFQPAVLTGWGGSQKQYLAGQLAVVKVADRTLSIAAVFHPRKPPKQGDPSQGDARDALEALFGELAKQFKAADS